MKLGTKVTAPHRLHRLKASKHVWKELGGKPVTGIYIGWRTYANGTTGGGYNIEDPIYFIPKGYIKVALIVPNERSKPIPVLYDSMVAV